MQPIQPISNVVDFMSHNDTRDNKSKDQIF